MGISNKFPGDFDTAGAGAALWGPLTKIWSYQKQNKGTWEGQTLLNIPWDYEGIIILDWSL